MKKSLSLNLLLILYFFAFQEQRVDDDEQQLAALFDQFESIQGDSLLLLTGNQHQYRQFNPPVSSGSAKFVEFENSDFFQQIFDYRRFSRHELVVPTQPIVATLTTAPLASSVNPEFSAFPLNQESSSTSAVSASISKEDMMAIDALLQSDIELGIQALVKAEKEDYDQDEQRLVELKNETEPGDLDQVWLPVNLTQDNETGELFLIDPSGDLTDLLAVKERRDESGDLLSTPTVEEYDPLEAVRQDLFGRDEEPSETGEAAAAGDLTENDIPFLRLESVEQFVDNLDPAGFGDLLALFEQSVPLTDDSDSAVSLGMPESESREEADSASSASSGYDAASPYSEFDTNESTPLDLNDPARHVLHNHTYQSEPGNRFAEMHPHSMRNRLSRRSQASSSDIDGQRSKDERLLVQYRIPFTLDDITQSSIDEFALLLEKLSPSQLSLVKEMRKRCKNKLAAQNCRKRKVTAIVGLEEEIQNLEDDRERLRQEKVELADKLNSARRQLDQLTQSLIVKPKRGKTLASNR